MSDYRAELRPYRTLGWHLKTAREQLKRSLAEVAGAVEIDLTELEHIEYGYQRPTEELLLLLMTHLGFKDAEATSLWELAGYASDEPAQADDQAVSVSAQDMRVIYTDLVHVVVNDYGVVINFMQGSGANRQPMIAARVGMSKEHAASVLEVLKETMQQASQPKQVKQLPAQSRSKKK